MELTKEAQSVLDEVNKGTHPNDMEDMGGDLYMLVSSWSCSDCFCYGIWDGGYIKPEMILKGEDLAKVKEASEILEEFKDLWRRISIEF